jgi:hypothetical protein
VENPIRATQLVEWALTHELELMNEVDLYIFQRGCSQSVIDLTFISSELNEKSCTWYIDDQETSGSHHAVIQFSFQMDDQELVENPLFSNQFNFEKAD